MTSGDSGQTQGAPGPEDRGPGGRAPARPRRRRRRLFWILSGVAAVVVVWAAVCAIQLYRGMRDARDGVNEVSVARSQLSGSDLVAEAPLAPLATAQADFARASSNLGWPLLAPLRIVPVIGRQYVSVHDLAVAADKVTEEGRASILEAHSFLGLPHAAGSQRVATLMRLSALAASTHAQLTKIDLGPSDGLISPLAGKRSEFAGQLNRVTDSLQRASAAAATVAQLLTGPRTFLLLAANNAEMRAGSGMFLQAGTLTTSGGFIHVAGLTDTGSLALSGDGVPLAPDVAARWGWLKPNIEWRNLGLTPQFDVNGPQAAAMWQAATGQHVDGVLAVDIEALRELLTATGPLLVDGQVISSDNVVTVLMHDQYNGLGDSTTNAGRRDALADLVSATFAALDHQQIDMSTLATAVTKAAEGRHILAWSEESPVEAAWQTAGVAGRLGPDAVLTAVVNRGGNKLDQYLSVSTNLKLQPRGDTTDGTLTVHLDNQTPPGQVRYVAGPFPGTGNSYGEYVGFVAVNLPLDTLRASLASGAAPVSSGREGPTWLLAAPVALDAGDQTDVVVRFTMGSPHGEVQVVPSARVPAVSWDAGGGGQGDSFADDKAHTISW